VQPQCFQVVAPQKRLRWRQVQSLSWHWPRLWRPRCPSCQQTWSPTRACYRRAPTDAVVCLQACVPAARSLTAKRCTQVACVLDVCCIRASCGSYCGSQCVPGLWSLRMRFRLPAGWVRRVYRVLPGRHPLGHGHGGVRWCEPALLGAQAGRATACLLGDASSHPSTGNEKAWGCWQALLLETYRLRQAPRRAADLSSGARAGPVRSAAAASERYLWSVTPCLMAWPAVSLAPGPGSLVVAGTLAIAYGVRCPVGLTPPHALCGASAQRCLNVHMCLLHSVCSTTGGSRLRCARQRHCERRQGAGENKFIVRVPHGWHNFRPPSSDLAAPPACTYLCWCPAGGMTTTPGGRSARTALSKQGARAGGRWTGRSPARACCRPGTWRCGCRSRSPPWRA